MGVQHRCLFVGTSPCPQVPCAGVLGAVGHAACDPTLGCGPWRGPGGSQTPPPHPQGLRGKGEQRLQPPHCHPLFRPWVPQGGFLGLGGRRDGGQGVQRAVVSVWERVCVCAELPLVAVAARPGTGTAGCPMAAPRAAGSSWSPRSLRSPHLGQARHHYAINEGFPQPLPCSPPLFWWHRSGDAVFPSAAESKCLRPVPAAQASNVQVFFRLCILLVAQRDGELWLS